MDYYAAKKKKKNNLLPHEKTKMNLTDVMMGKKPDTKSACYTIPLIWNWKNLSTVIDIRRVIS